MKKQFIIIRFSLAFLLSLFLLLGCQSDSITKKSFKIHSEDVLGQWGGFSDDGVYYIIDIRFKDIGIFGYVPYNGKPVVLGISSWRCENKRIVVSLEPGGQDPDAAHLIDGQPGLVTMSLTVSGPGWHRNVNFVRKSIHDHQQKLLEDRILEFESSH